MHVFCGLCAGAVKTAIKKYWKQQPNFYDEESDGDQSEVDIMSVNDPAEVEVAPNPTQMLDFMGESEDFGMKNIQI
jgi:hypothetical protein